MSKLLNKTQRIFIYIALITLVSKILGFLRETLIASEFGANALTDAYVVAVTIVTSFYMIMGDVINNSFIPQFIRIKKTDSYKAERFASSIINLMLLATIVLLVIFALFTKQVVFIFAPGLRGDNLINAINFTRILLPTLIITGLSISIRSILQSHNSFIGPVVMGIPNHMAVIAYLAFGSAFGVKGLVYATALGTSLQLIAQLPFIKGTGFRYRGIGCFEHKSIMEFLGSIGFILIGSSVNQINTLVDKALASFTGYGNISILNYANKLNLFVAAVFVSSITTVIFPKLAESTDYSHLQSKVREYMRLIIAVLVPVSLLLIYFSYEVVYILFGRGSFTEQNVIDTARVLAAYSFGIIPFGMSEVFNRTFYSLGDTKIPMKLGIVSVFTNIVLNLIMVRYLGILGLALATTIASTVYMAASFAVINKKISIIYKELIKWILVVCTIGILFLTLLFIIDTALAGVLGKGLLYMMVRVCIASVAALTAYGVLIYRYGGYNGN